MASIKYVSFKNFDRFTKVETVGTVEIVHIPSENGNFVGSASSAGTAPTENECGYILNESLNLAAGNVMYIQSKADLSVEAKMYINFNDEPSLQITGNNNFGLRFDSDFSGTFRPVDNQQIIGNNHGLSDPNWHDFRMTVNEDGTIAFHYRASTGLGRHFDPDEGNTWLSGAPTSTSLAVSGDWTTKPAYLAVWTACADRLFYVDEFHLTDDGSITRPNQD